MAISLKPDDPFVKNVISAESGGNPNAVSPAGAIGLMQIMPATGAMYGASPADLHNPVENVRIGTEYLSYLINKYGGDRFKGLVAYHSGPGRVDRGVYLPISVNYAHGILSKPGSGAESPPPAAQSPAAAPALSPASNPWDVQMDNTAPPSLPNISAPAQPQGIEGLLSHPLVQAALATYLGTISSPRRMGLGGALGRGGLMGLGQFAQAEQMRQEMPLRQAQTQEALAKAQGEVGKEQAIQALPPTERGYAEMGVLPDYMKQHGIQLANKSYGDQLLLAHPNDRLAAQIATSAYSAPTFVGDKLEDQYQKAKAAPGALQLQQVNITKGKAEIEKAKAEAKKVQIPQTNAVDIYNLSDPSQTRQVAAPKGQDYTPPPGWARGTPSPTVSSPALREQAMRTKTMQLSSTYDRNHPMPHFTGIGLRSGALQKWHDEKVSNLVAAGISPEAAEQEVTAQTGLTGSGVTPSSKDTAAAPAGATAEILAPDGSVAGHMGPDGKPIWLPGKEPR